MKMKRSKKRTNNNSKAYRINFKTNKNYNSKNIDIFYILTLLALILVLFSFFVFYYYAPNSSLEINNTIDDIQVKEYVTQIIDGDTFVLNNGEYVRLIGINAPEKGELYYTESKDFLSSLLINKQLIFESDIDKRDKYGRLLYYVYSNGIFVNELMVKQGYAKPLTIPPNTKYKDNFDYAWNQCLENPKRVCNENNSK